MEYDEFERNHTAKSLNEDKSKFDKKSLKNHQSQKIQTDF